MTEGVGQSRSEALVRKQHQNYGSRNPHFECRSRIEFTAALQKLGSYQPHENEKSREFLATAPTVLAGLSGSRQDPESV